jgi:hypothetical protein
MARFSSSRIFSLTHQEAGRVCSLDIFSAIAKSFTYEDTRCPVVETCMNAGRTVFDALEP